MIWILAGLAVLAASCAASQQRAQVATPSNAPEKKEESEEDDPPGAEFRERLQQTCRGTMAIVDMHYLKCDEDHDIEALAAKRLSRLCEGRSYQPAILFKTGCMQPGNVMSASVGVICDPAPQGEEITEEQSSD
jgi:hypothetical protein